MLNDIAISAVILCVFTYLVAIIQDWRIRHRKPKQTCFVYCPMCRNELVSSDSFVEDKDGIVKYKCDKCGNISFWDFIHYPVPYLRTCARDCKHFYMDHTGQDYGCWLKRECDPDTMVKFEPRMYRNECEEVDDVYD